MARTTIFVGGHRTAPNRDAARKHYARAIELAPEFADAYRARGEFYSATTGDKQRALADLDRALELEPDDYLALRSRAVVLGKMGESEKALAALALILRHHPHDVETHVSIGDIHLRLKNWQSAIDAYSRVLEIEPSWYHVHKRLAEAHVHLGQYEQALSDLRRALELNPLDTSTLKWIGVSQIARSPDFRERLMELVDDAVERSPNRAEALQDRAQLFMQIGEYDKAEADLAEAAKVDPQLSTVWQQWGRLYLIRGMRKEAHEKLSKAIELKEDEKLPWSLRAWCHQELGQWEEAATNLEQYQTS